MTESVLSSSYGRRSRAEASRRAVARFARKKPLAMFGAVVILVMLVLAAFPGLVATTDPNAQDPANSLQNASSEHYFGTDNFGRDVFSRVVHGARSSVVIGFGSVAISLCIAVLVGSVSGYLGGWLDTVVQRFVDAVMALPWLVLLMSVMALIGPGIGNTVFVLGVLTAPAASRVVRGSVLSLRTRQFVEAARATGCSGPRILFRHILPNITAELTVLASIGIGSAILAESSLSFLGFGVVPPTPSWGYMLGIEGRRFLTTAPWLAIFPGLAIALCVFSFNVLGDGLRDVLDPRLRT